MKQACAVPERYTQELAENQGSKAVVALVVTQTNPRHTRRLYKLVGWGLDDLSADLASGGFGNVALSVSTLKEERRISPKQLARWSGAGGKDLPDHWILLALHLGRDLPSE